MTAFARSLQVLLAAHLLISTAAGLAVARPPKKRKPEAPPVAGTVRKNSRGGLKYVLDPAGRCRAGPKRGTLRDGLPPEDLCDSDEKPLHQLTISKGFRLGETEVTAGAYQRFANDSGRSMPPAPERNSSWRDEGTPMVELAWAEAWDYCRWAGGRLPREAECEWASRGGNPNSRYGQLDDIAWYAVNSGDGHLDTEHLWDADSGSRRNTTSG
jgi:formylglycine-generating enzyme required for sulfatase activity